METFSALLALYDGNPPVTSVFSLLQWYQWRRALMYSVIWAWTNGWANNWDAGDMRRHRTPYEVNGLIIRHNETLCIFIGYPAPLERAWLSLQSLDSTWWNIMRACWDGLACWLIMMTSSNGNIFCVTGPLCGEFTGHRWIPLTKASDAELWCFLWSAPE